MNKKLVSAIMLATLMVSFSVPYFAQKNGVGTTIMSQTETMESIAKDIVNNLYVNSTEETSEASVATKEEAELIMALENMNAKMASLDAIEDTQEWFITYKNIVEEYSYVLDPPESIYDYYSEEEINKLFGVVQAEVGDEYTFEQKCNVASVIFNRIYCNEDSFARQNTLSDALTSDQFATINNGRYKQVEVSETTKLACEYVFMFGSTTEALFFDSDGSLPYKWVDNDGAHNLYTLWEVI